MEQELWFYAVGTERKGPVDSASLKKLAETRVISGASLVWKKGMQAWEPAAKIPGIIDETPPLPESIGDATRPSVSPEQPQSSLDKTSAAPNPLASVVLLGAASSIMAIAALFILTRHSNSAILFTFLGIITFIAAYTFISIFLYRSWCCIPDPHRSITPEKAVGFLFIPFFNFYWFFVAVRGLSVDTNKALKARDGEGFLPASVDIATACVIVFIASFVLGWVPFIGKLAFGGSIVLFGIWLVQQARATAVLLKTEDRTSSVKPYLIGLFVSAGLFTLLTLPLDMDESSGSSEGSSYRPLDDPQQERIRRRNQANSKRLLDAMDAFRAAPDPYAK